MTALTVILTRLARYASAIRKAPTLLSNDAGRKSCAALLEAQGLRATSRGGHVAVRDAVVAQFASLAGGDALRSFDRLRRRRNDIEYPAGDSGVDADEVDEALERAEGIVAYAEKVIDTLPVF